MSSLSRYISLLTAIILCSLLNAQDIHFSQFYMSPMSLNPAMTGNQGVEYRFAANHRNQWRSVTDAPFETFSVSAERAAIPKAEALGAGLFIMNDRTGDGLLNTLVVNLSTAYAMSLNADSSASLSAGLQLGFTQRSIDYSGLRFDQQYNGFIYDANRPSGENFANDGFNHLNTNLGVLYSKKLDDGEIYEIGISGFNLNNPQVSFQDDAAVKLDSRFNVHAEYVKEISDKWYALPAFQGMWQGAYQELLLGSRFRYTFRDDYMGLRRGYVGAFGRLGDGAYLMLGMDYDEWKFGVSYDLNFSSLQVASQNRGGWELSAIYLLDVFNEVRKKHRACPAWL